MQGSPLPIRLMPEALLIMAYCAIVAIHPSDRAETTEAALTEPPVREQIHHETGEFRKTLRPGQLDVHGSEPKSSGPFALKTADLPMFVMVTDLERPEFSDAIPLGQDGTLSIGQLGAGRYLGIAIPKAEELREPSALWTALSLSSIIDLKRGEWQEAPPITLATAKVPPLVLGQNRPE